MEKFIYENWNYILPILTGLGVLVLDYAIGRSKAKGNNLIAQVLVIARNILKKKK